MSHLIPEKSYRLFEKVLEDLELKHYSVIVEPITTAITYVTFVAKARVEAKDVHEFIIKCGPDNDYIRSVVSIYKYFKREIHTYENVFPEFQKLQKEKNVVELFDCYPKIYYSVNELGNELIIMENMATRGYRSVLDSATLDYEHMTAVLEEYAHFHALSFALRDQKKDVFDELGKDASEYYFNDCTKEFRCLFSKCCTRALDSLDLAKEVEVYAAVAKIFIDFPNVMEKVFGNQLLSDHSVFTQTDCRLTNLLFKYKEDGRVSRAALIDWQLLTLASPVVDLIYVIFINTKKDFRDKHYKELISTYYANFSSFLRKLGSDPDRLFSLETLQEHIKKFGVHTLLLATITLYSILETSKDKPKDDNHFDTRMRDVIIDCYNLGFLNA